MLRANIGVLQGFRFLACGSSTLHAGVWNVADHFGLRTRTDLLLDFHADRFKIEPHF